MFLSLLLVGWLGTDSLRWSGSPVTSPPFFFRRLRVLVSVLRFLIPVIRLL